MPVASAMFEHVPIPVGPSIGSWPEWITAVGTTAAFLVAAGSYSVSVKVRREAQARLVYSKMTDVSFHAAGEQFPILQHGARMGNGSSAIRIVQDEHGNNVYLAVAPVMRATVVVHNGSKELIGSARVQIVDVGLGVVRDDFSISIDAIDPESDHTVEFTWLNDHHPGFPSVGTTVIFRDASGQWWRRHRSEPIERVHADPENVGPTPAERAAIRTYQRLNGYSPLIDEPRPTLRVIWHRTWRRMRGKNPLP